jgi:4-diphosphocytidyl-2-C-methyl-D-erythritol kinase
VVLVSPGFSSGTAEAYRLLDSFRETDHGKSRFIDHAARSTGESLIADLAKEPSRWHFGNDFLPALMQAGNQDEQDAYRRLMMELQTLGADFSGLTGSGSTCFGIFSHKGAAEQAVNSLLEHWNFVQLTFPLARRADAVLEW